MKELHNLIPPIQIIYAEEFVSEDPDVKASQLRVEKTFSRIAKMQEQALLRGQILGLRTKVKEDGDKIYNKLFPMKVFEKKENLPRLKISEIISETKQRRIQKSSEGVV